MGKIIRLPAAKPAADHRAEAAIGVEALRARAADAVGDLHAGLSAVVAEQEARLDACERELAAAGDIGPAADLLRERIALARGEIAQFRAILAVVVDPAD